MLHPFFVLIQPPIPYIGVDICIHKHTHMMTMYFRRKSAPRRCTIKCIVCRRRRAVSTARALYVFSCNEFEIESIPNVSLKISARLFPQVFFFFLPHTCFCLYITYTIGVNENRRDAVGTHRIELQQMHAYKDGLLNFFFFFIRCGERLCGGSLFYYTPNDIMAAATTTTTTRYVVN